MDGWRDGGAYTHAPPVGIPLREQKRQQKLEKERAVLEEKLRKGFFKAQEIVVVLEHGLLGRATGEAICKVRSRAFVCGLVRSRARITNIHD